MARKDELAPTGKVNGPAPAPPVSPAAPESAPAVIPPAASTRTLQLGTPPGDLLQAGKDAWLAGDFTTAIERLREFLARAPKDARAPEAQFLVAEACRAEGRFAEAADAYDAFLRLYPANPRVSAAWFGLAESRLRAGDRSGCDLLRRAVSQYPAASQAAPAREMLSTHCP